MDPNSITGNKITGNANDNALFTTHKFITTTISYLPY